MKGVSRVLLAGLVICSAAYAQDWQIYTYPNPGFAIQFPAVPEVQTTTSKNAVGATLPVTRYVVRQDGVQYTLSVTDYSSTNDDALSTIGETAKSFSAKGTVTAKSGAHVNGTTGRELTITESDGSRSAIAIFFVNKHLYTAVGQALPPNPTERSADTVRFQESLQLLGDNSGFFGLFGGSRTRSNPSASSVTSRSASGVSAGGGTGGGGTGSGAAGSSGSSGQEHVRAVANQRADAACTGKSAGDLVQVDTPTGPVPATCILTARPDPPSGSTSGGSPGARNSNGRRSATPPN